jgi:YD repeat-containing protein
MKRNEKMRITYDSKVDALYIRFIETTVTTEHVAEGVALDYDSDGRLAGIEILDAVKRFGTKDVFKKVTLEELALQSV